MKKVTALGHQPRQSFLGDKRPDPSVGSAAVKPTQSAAEKTTDDTVTILSFSESEDNISSSLAGLQLTDRQIQGLNAMLTEFAKEAKRAWGWNLDVYIRNAPRTINREQLEDERKNYAWPPNPLTGDVLGLLSLTADEDDESSKGE